MKDGYYWVKYYEEWEIGYLQNGFWRLKGYALQVPFINIVRSNIGDYIETPDKYKDGK